MLGGAAVGLVVLGLILFFVLGGGRPTPSPTPTNQVPEVVLKAVTSPSPAVVAAVGTGGNPVDLTRVAATTTLKDPSGKPLVVYVGAEYCPFCAAERWSLIMALARFGTFHNLSETTSSSTDVYPNTSTFTFHGASYTSPDVAFQPVEIQDRNGQPLETPPAQVSQLFDTYDQPPYTVTSRGIPFLDIAGRFVLKQTSYSPQVLQGLTWDQIAAALSDPNSPVTRAIVGNANTLTAAVCSVTGNQPSAACALPAIQAIETELNALPPVGG
ncbi:MAG TPA: DUF929 family protein [Candidatus Limnocylindrales bacterium]|nr:DUF929 family protein [Candidatus Limnocylindrales bacterium]